MSFPYPEQYLKVLASLPGGEVHILVVDDNEDMVASLSLLLQVIGHNVSTASDGQEAVERAATIRPEVIFLDLMMPRLDGFEVARRIRAQPWGKDMVLVALTALDGEEIQRHTQEAGFDHHWIKPVELATIEALLEE